MARKKFTTMIEEEDLKYLKYLAYIWNFKYSNDVIEKLIENERRRQDAMGEKRK